MNILLIEDNRDIATALAQALSNHYVVTRAYDGASGLRHALHGNFRLIILDLHLPDAHGFDICEELRARNCQTPILVLSGEAEVMSKIKLLDAGADDYLTKPFSLGELKARLRVLTRQPAISSAIPVDYGELTIDSRKREVRRDDTVIALRRKEFALLECLLRHAGQVVSKQTLGEYGWEGLDTPWPNTIDVHIKHLRDKLDRPFDQPLVKTVHGLGYRLDVTALQKVKAERVTVT